MSNETEAAPAGSNSPVRPSASRALRVWPAVILVALMIITRFVPAFLRDLGEVIPGRHIGGALV